MGGVDAIVIVHDEFGYPEDVIAKRRDVRVSAEPDRVTGRDEVARRHDEVVNAA